MRRGLLVGLSLVVASGCNFGIKTCETAAECESGAECRDGFCVIGDGGTTGGGGGSTGGGGGGSQCPATCPAGYSCDVGGSVCLLRISGIAFDAPAEGAVTNQTSVQVTAHFVASGSVTMPASMQLSLDDGGTRTVSGSNNNYTTTLMGLTEASHQVRLWAELSDAGVSATRNFVVDVTPPGVTVEVQPRPATLGDADVDGGNPWKKDEWALVKVTVDGGMPAAVANVASAWGGAVRTASGCAACGAGCGCFEVDLAGSTLAGLRGNVSMRVDGISDSAGNVAPRVDAMIPVTRLKWARDLLGTATRLPPLAVTENGEVVAAVDETPTTSNSTRLTAFAQDGGLVWRNTALLGSVTAGPAAASNGVWVATDNGTTSQLQRYSAIGAGSATDCIASGVAFTGDLVVGVTDAGVEVPIGVRAGQIRVGDGTCNAHPLSTPAPTDPNSRPSVVVKTQSGSLEPFVAYEGDTRLWKASLVGTSWSGLGSATLPLGTQPRGLFLDGDGFAGGGGVVGNGALFVTSATGALSGSITQSLTAANAGPPVVGNGYVYYGNTAGDLVRAVYASGVFGSTLSVAVGQGNLQGAMPVLGKGGLIYVVGAAGGLSVRRASDLSEVWNGSLASLSGNGNVSQLALDAYRSGAGKDCSRGLGVLYVTTRSGSVASLRAVVVDSAGLEPGARWPKYQKDNANSGNGSGSLGAWTCP